MINDDTIKLLKECNAGVKTAINSIDEVIDRVQNPQFKDYLQQIRHDHEVIGDKTHVRLNAYQDSGKEPNPMARAMSWLKINTKLLPQPKDQEIAELMMDGCNMGIQSVAKYLHQYPAAEKEVKDMVDELITLEERFLHDLEKYL